ncbi:hypothetical protein GCM10010320_38370 [Streptomyces caelestis]|jgi:Ca2+:H+ antiporter|uniref:Ca2+/H+ antiporter n=1 Tax=Streptomyces caelestis TaxID=36816 RepID=A0A7W9LRZ7_9ACTN|nr:Ca2+/H+ antiporter [Streptomyces caelestis]GGW53808.1 hypothetical protein GCM10010320_38370 [Streptomyces caelestis]
MIVRRRPLTAQWTTLVPFLAAVLLIFTWGRDLPTAVVALVTLVLAGAVLAAVHHAEVVAHRVGEPFGSLVLAHCRHDHRGRPHRHPDGRRR